jgi:GDP-D-mannose dehydratase
MNKKIALITGISGQDGSYLSEYLLSLSYTKLTLGFEISIILERDFTVIFSKFIGTV